MQPPTPFQQALEYQADQIEMVLASHRVPARVMGGMVTPRWIRYQTLPELTTKLSRINALAEEIALRLGAQSVRIARQGATVQIDVPRTDAQTVQLLSLCKKLTNVPRQSALLGLDESGLPLLLRLSSPEVAHVLVALRQYRCQTTAACCAASLQRCLATYRGARGRLF